MSGKKIFVTRSSLPNLDEYIDEIREIWSSHWLTNMGDKHEKLRIQMQKYLDVKHLQLMVNGHMALELALQALSIKGEVITTPFTFVSTTHAIVRNGLKPIFCDIRPDDYTMNTEKLESLITDHTSAILPVHVYGNVCHVEEIERIAEKYDLIVLYDAAHAFGETYKGRSIASFGDVSCYSFHATKVFNTIEGGAVCYSKSLDEFETALYRLRNFGIRNETEVDVVGTNAKMNEFCASMGICNLRHIDDEIYKRKLVAERYCENLYGISGLILPFKQSHVKYNYAYFPVVFDEKSFGSTRNEVYKALLAHNIYARKYFYPITSMFECYRNRFVEGDTPIALHISKRILTLPIYADLKLRDVDMICNIIKSCKSM